MAKSPWPPKLLLLFYDAFVNTKNCVLYKNLTYIWFACYLHSMAPLY